MNVKLLNVSSGISKTNKKRWAKIQVLTKTSDGNYVVMEEFVSEEIKEKAKTFSPGSTIDLIIGVNQFGKFYVSDIKFESVSDNYLLGDGEII